MTKPARIRVSQWFVIVLESTWLGHYESSSNQSLSSFVGEMMANNGQAATAEEYGLIPFETFKVTGIRAPRRDNLMAI